MSPSDRLYGTIPVSKIQLHKLAYTGRIMFIVLFICSLSTLSDTGLLLFFSLFVAFKISSFEICWFISSFISFKLSRHSVLNGS